MRLRLSLLSFILVLLVAACGNEVSVEVAPDDAIDAALAQALDAALADCFDPLHDSDGSGGFFEFCSRANQARGADRLDCFYANEPEERCADWVITRADIPPQYFDREPVPSVAAAAQAEAPPALEVPPPVIDDATGLPASMQVLEWSEFGGCALSPDGCRSYDVFGDGRVEGFQNGELRAKGQVDPVLVRTLFDAADVDTDALLASLGPGPCESASDGIDHSVWILPADVRLDSCDFDLSGDHTLIVAARQLGEAAERAATME